MIERWGGGERESGLLSPREGEKAGCSLEGLKQAEVAQMLPLFKETVIKGREGQKFEKRDLFSFNQLSNEGRGGVS